jgi:hypothetical protein
MLFVLLPHCSPGNRLASITNFCCIFCPSLNATDNDRDEAERLLDNFIGLLFEDGVLATWRYRIVLDEIRRGL